jgi:hypothetical protein
LLTTYCLLVALTGLILIGVPALILWALWRGSSVGSVALALWGGILSLGIWLFIIGAAGFWALLIIGGLLGAL